MFVDTLIVGQGLAGSLLAWELQSRGQRILVVDRDEAVSASKVAAGLVTPVSGSRFNIPDGLPERLSYAKEFYWAMEERSGQKMFHHLRTLRFFQADAEKEAYEARLARDERLLHSFTGPLPASLPCVRPALGGFEMRGGGWLDLPVFLEITRQHLLETVSYAIGRVFASDLKVKNNGIRWRNIVAGKIVFCEGWRARENVFFAHIPMHSAKGDILDLRPLAPYPTSHILSCGSWLLPQSTSLFRAGSTYQHHFDDASPVPEGQAQVLENVARLTDQAFEIIGHRAAIRPIIRRSQPYMGHSPLNQKIFLFNGLGSKGSLNGPWHAARLAEHLISGHPLPPSCDVNIHFAPK
jgi:glycine oxidase